MNIDTPRLALRELTTAQMRRIVGGDRGAAAPPHPEHPPPGTLTGLRIRVERSSVPAGPWFQMVRRHDGVAVGDLNFHDPPDENGEVVVGMDLVPELRGMGYGTETLSAACAWALAQPGVRSVRGQIDRENLASRRMAEKVEMRFVGVAGRDRLYRIP